MFTCTSVCLGLAAPLRSVWTDVVLWLLNVQVYVEFYRILSCCKVSDWATRTVTTLALSLVHCISALNHLIIPDCSIPCWCVFRHRPAISNVCGRYDTISTISTRPAVLLKAKEEKYMYILRVHFWIIISVRVAQLWSTIRVVNDQTEHM